LVDVCFAVALFVLVGLIAGDFHTAHGSVNIHLTTVPTLAFLGIVGVYYFAYRRPARRKQRPKDEPDVLREG
jgi:hypothetical protein